MARSGTVSPGERSLLCATTWFNLAVGRSGGREVRDGRERREGTTAGGSGATAARDTRPSHRVDCRRSRDSGIVRRSYLSLARAYLLIPLSCLVPRIKSRRERGDPAVYSKGKIKDEDWGTTRKSRLLLDLIPPFSCSRRLLLHFHSLLSLSLPENVDT